MECNTAFNSDRKDNKKNFISVGAFHALLTDLGETFDCFLHKPLIPKLDVYGFKTSSLRLTYNYLNERDQKVKVSRTYSLWRETLYGIPQG